MTLSTSSSKPFAIPLLQDLRDQRPAVRRLLQRALLFLLLFFILDRLLAVILLGGIERYYGLNRPANVLLVGHSHTVLGIDKVELERLLGVPVAKFAMEGAITPDRLEFIRYYFRRWPGTQPVVCYDVSAFTFTGSGLSANSYRNLFPFCGDAETRAYVRRHCQTPGEFWLRMAVHTLRYDDMAVWCAIRGYSGNWNNLKQGAVDVRRLAGQIADRDFLHIGFDNDNMAVFQETLKAVQDNGSRMNLVFIPTIDVLNQAEPAQFAKAISLLRAAETEFPNARFLDYHAEYESRHELFYDAIHMGPKGQVEITKRLAADLAEELSAGEKK